MYIDSQFYLWIFPKFWNSEKPNFSISGISFHKLERERKRQRGSYRQKERERDYFDLNWRNATTIKLRKSLMCV